MGRHIRNHTNPSEFAVIPIVTKKLNASKALAPGGVDINTLVKKVLTSIEIYVSSD